MLSWLFDFWGCVSHIDVCAADAANAVPNDWWFWIGFVLGAIVGKWGLAVVAIVVGAKFIPRGNKGDEQQLDLPLEDALPPVRRRVPPHKRQTIRDFFRRKQ